MWGFSIEQFDIKSDLRDFGQKESDLTFKVILENGRLTASRDHSLKTLLTTVTCNSHGRV